MNKHVNKAVLQSIYGHIEEFERSRRRVLSSIFPILADPIVFGRQMVRVLLNIFQLGFGLSKDSYFKCVTARHSSVLVRKLGDSDNRLQINKIKNLAVAIKYLDGLVIKPGQTFSLWKAIGKPTYKRGYVDGMLLSNGKVVEGVGGGLCQMANFLHWIFLHADISVVERHHHSVDVFPDSGRVLPFGSGATVFFNYIDLKIKNISNHPLQIKLWLTDTHLKGQILSTEKCAKKFHVYEQNHCFINRGGKYYRFNEIWRETLVEGQSVEKNKVVQNFAPVAYKVDEKILRQFGYEILDVADTNIQELAVAGIVA